MRFFFLFIFAIFSHIVSAGITSKLFKGIAYKGDTCNDKLSAVFECHQDLECRNGICEYRSHSSPEVVKCFQQLQGIGVEDIQPGQAALYGGYCYQAVNGCEEMYHKINFCEDPVKYCASCGKCIQVDKDRCNTVNRLERIEIKNEILKVLTELKISMGAKAKDFYKTISKKPMDFIFGFINPSGSV